MPYPQRETIIHITVIPSKATHKQISEYEVSIAALNTSLLWSNKGKGAEKFIKSKQELGFPVERSH